jgi:mycofactocin system creatininase family protein
MSLRLAEAAWPEVQRHARRAVLLPLGAIEQHGPHLPLDTDVRVASAVAAAAAAREDVAVAPPLPLGASGEHAGFPGTLSIGAEALERVLVEFGRHACGDWDAVLFVNAHGGNAGAIGAAVAALEGEGRRCAVYHASVRGGDAHAGRTETSLMLHLAPELVRVDALEPGDARPIAALLPRLRAGGVRSVSPNGVLGDPRAASAAEGERVLAEMAAACAEALTALLERDG